MTLVVNFLGGPCSGKSTLAAEIFVHFKKEKLSCELVTEYAKDKTWEENYFTLANQLYVFGKQHHKMYRINNKVDLIITDSSLLFSIVYGNLKPEQPFYQLVLEEYNKFDNINFSIERSTDYQSTGRNQDEEGAKELDELILKTLTDNKIDYHSYNLNDGIETMIEKIQKELDEVNNS